MASKTITCFIMVLAADISLAAIDPDGAAENGQFHIQTDEGPERYFKYQTSSGQYRKEKRLQDGTVIGSYGWVDANGYLRLRDYIADDQGYRITKSKMVYVGVEEPIGNALKIAKTVPSENGLVEYPRNPPVQSRRIVSSTTTSRPVIVSPIVNYPSTYRATTPAFPSTPSVYISPNSQPTGFNIPTVDPYGSKPSLEFEPPRSTIEDNELNYDASQRRNVIAPSPNAIQSNYDKSRIPQRSLSDAYARITLNGVPVNRNGFQYYLRKQYQEEDSNGVDKEGSFGYVDPFGIRRVIYYKAGPEGFVHRKNNRYVGHDGTPYDPRPIDGATL